MSDLEYCLITGAAGGLGNTTARLLSKLGYNLIITDIFDPLELKKNLLEPGVQVVSKQLDVSSPSSVNDLVRYAEENSLKITGVVNFAGIIRDRSIFKMTFEEWNAVININLSGTFNVVKAFAEIMKNNGGSIITIGSVVARYGNFGQANYVASKAGVEALTKTAAREFAKYGIRVNCIVPGIIKSPMTDTIPKDFLDQSIRMIPLGRIGNADEIASVVKFLLSNDSSYITGTSILVDGGIRMD
ncbi:MAG: SDR family oxidoreductase [Candidatus Kariarchaeaceae archaeon]|jgi:NAD(P)-dependent dehydrogenase (short-subunit alcohol dehydrogenase family)